MKRNEIVKNLLREGFTEKTLIKFSDKQLSDLHERVIGESVTKVSSADLKTQDDLMKQKKPFEVYEEKPSSGLSKEKKSEIVKKAKKGEDIDKKGKGFKKVEKSAKEGGAENPEAVAAAAMWKNVKREQEQIKEWIDKLAGKNYHKSITSKNEITEMIKTKLNEKEYGSKVKVGHNGIPEFMTYDSITSIENDGPSIAPSKPKTKPGTKPGKPSLTPKPGPDTRPKAMRETGGPEIAPSKPKTKPGTKPGKPSLTPKPGPDTRPKAIKENRRKK